MNHSPDSVNIHVNAGLSPLPLSNLIKIVIPIFSKMPAAKIGKIWLNFNHVKKLRRLTRAMGKVFLFARVSKSPQVITPQYQANLWNYNWKQRICRNITPCTLAKAKISPFYLFFKRCQWFTQLVSTSAINHSLDPLSLRKLCWRSTFYSKVHTTGKVGNFYFFFRKTFATRSSSS